MRRDNRLADSVIRRIVGYQLPDPRDLLVRSAQEMNRLAGFLSKVFAEFADN